MPFITDDPIVPTGRPFISNDPAVPMSPEETAKAWESGQLGDDALTPAQALQVTLQKAKSRQDPVALIRGALAGTGQLISQGWGAGKELASYGLKNPPSVAGFGLTKAAAEGALRGSADLGQIGKNVLEGAVLNPYEIVSKAAEKRGWPAALAQAAQVMQPSLEVGTPMEKLAKIFPLETADVARQSMISDRQTALQRQQLAENKRSLLEELTTAGMADPMGMLPFGDSIPDSVRFGASPATAEALGQVMAPPAGLGNLTETVGMVADPTMLAAPGASLAAKLGAKVAPRMAARLGARQVAGQARQALLEGFEQAAQAAPPSRARFVGGPEGGIRDVGPVPPPVIQPRFVGGPDGTVSIKAPPVIPTTPELAPLLDAYTGAVRQAAGAPRGMGQAAVGRVGRVAEQIGGAVSRAAETVGDLADRYRTALGVISATAGAIKGPLGVLAGSQLPKAVSMAAKWAKETSRAGAALRTIAAADWKSSVPVWRQIAKDPNAPQWLVRGVTAPVVGRLTAGKLAEGAIRGGGRIAAGAAEGAATDALFAAADPEMGGEDIGAEAGPGGLIGFLSTSATARGAARQQKADAVAYDAMRIAARSIEAGANPLVVARASDRLMQTAAVMETLFRGSLTGQRGIKIDLMDAGQFAKVAGSSAEAAFFDPQTGRVAVNLETIDADGRQLHEVSHALMQSAASSNPAIVEHFRGLLGPDGLARARQEYQQALGREIPQDDAYIVGELFAESVANSLRGVDLSEGVPAAIGDTRTVSFFRDADVRKALRDASTQDLVRQQVDALTNFRPAVDLEREPGVKLDPAMAGKHPAFPVEQQANGTTGNDFVQQTPDGRTVATPPAQVRTRVRNRRREVLNLFPDTEPIPDAGPTAPPAAEVATRRTPAGIVQKTGTRLGDRFYATAQSFGEATKNMLRRVEDAIANGETLSGWYQQIGQGDNWAASVRESLGAIEAQFKDFIPYAFKVDKQGNLLVENYSLTALERKANQWANRQGPLSLEMWNGDIAAFRQDVQTYLKNHSEGRPGADGLGDGKRNVINVFLVGGNRTFEALNPLRVQARGKDRQGIVRSYRADRLQTVEPSEVQGFQKPDYGKQVRNMSPKVTPEQDATYLEAAGRGDLATAQRMLAEAAKAAANAYGSDLTDERGNPLLLQHATNSDWSVYDLSRGGIDRQNRGSGSAIWLSPFGSSIRTTRTGNIQVKKLYAFAKNALVLNDDADLQRASQRFGSGESGSFGYFVLPKTRENLLQAGYDAVIWNRKDHPPEVIVLNPNQIKSADPITRDDAGKVIPLSRRFDSENPDIRFSPTVTKNRNTALQEAAQQVRDGKMTREEYQRLVQVEKPYQDMAEVPRPLSTEEVRAAIGSARADRAGKAREVLQEGQRVGARIDIRASEAGSYVTTLHEPRTSEVSGFAGKPITYEGGVRLRNVRFASNATGALDIAAGRAKGTIATIEGDYMPTPAEQVYRQAQRLVNDPEWAQLGMDPERQSQFYLRSTGEPVVGADEVLQVGRFVLARNVQKASPAETAARTQTRYTGPDGQPVRYSAKVNEGEPGFFSKLERVVGAEMKGASMPASQLKAIIRNRGVKTEEMKWTKAEEVIDRLAAENGGKVPKDALLEQLRKSRSRMGTKVGGEGGSRWEVSDSQLREKFNTEDEAFDAKDEWLDNLVDLNAQDYHIVRSASGEWLIGDNYGEPAHIRSDSGRVILSRQAVFNDKDFAESQLRKALREMLAGEVRVREVEEDGPEFEEFTLPGGENYRELALLDPDIQQWEGGKSHDFNVGYDERKQPADINRRRVAHMRIKDRTDAKGRKGLFIEEIQSDRHQAGRRKGYKGEVKEQDLTPLVQAAQKAEDAYWNAKAKRDAAYMGYADKLNSAYNAFYRRVGVSDPIQIKALLQTSPEAAQAFEKDVKGVQQTLLDERTRLDDEVESLSTAHRLAQHALDQATLKTDPGIPDAPFRKDWPLQMFKRALRDAVDSGKRWIGWTNGQTQADRYDLSKQIKSLEYHPETKELYAYDLSGNDVFGGGKKMSDTELLDTIGKAAAEKLLAQQTDSDGAKRLEGPSLKIGGEGMEGFYDQMLPKEVAKYVKQWGAEVQQAEMPVSVEEDAMNGDFEGGEEVVNIWKVDITPEMSKSIKTQGQERYSPRIEQSVLDLDKLGNKDLPQVNAKTIPYPANPAYPNSIALPARWGLVNEKIVGMPKTAKEVSDIVVRQVDRLERVIQDMPEFARESARFYLDMAESSMLMVDAAFPSAFGREKWRGAELMLRFLALGSPRTGVSANATKSSYSTSAAASDFTAGLKIGFGSQQTGAKNTFAAWKKGLPFDMSGEGVDNKVRNFYMNGLAELIDLARNEGDSESIDYLMDAAAAGLDLIKPGEKVSAEQHPEVQRLLDGMATVDMWDMAAKGYAWPGWISNKSARPGEGKTPWVWTEEKHATKSTLKSPMWARIAKELSKKKRVVRSPADLRYQEARALRVDGNKDWDATTWAERIKQPFEPDTEITTFRDVSEEGLSPGGAGPLYDAQQTIDGLVADEINRRGLANLFGKDKLLARNAQEILWALERLDNPLEANNELALFGNTFKALASELNRLRTDEMGPVMGGRPKPIDRGATVLKAMESAYAKLASQDLPLEVVSVGTTPEARLIQSAVQRLRDTGVDQPELVVTRAVADNLQEFLTQAADSHGVDVTVDSVAVGDGGYTEEGAPAVNPNMVLRLRGNPDETRNLLEILSRALDQDGGNIFRRPTISEINTPTTKFNTVVTFATKGMTTDQKTAFFMDLNRLKDADGNSFFTGFTETADGMAIGDQFYGGDMGAQVESHRFELLRILRKHGVSDFWADSLIIETVSRKNPEPEGLREQPFAVDIMEEIKRRLETVTADSASTFPQNLDEKARALRRLEMGKTSDFSGKTALTRYFVEARSSIDAAMLRGIVDEARGEELKEALTQVEKLREPEVQAKAAEKAQDRAKVKALELRRKASKERRKAAN